MEHTNIVLHIIKLPLRDKMQQHSIYRYYWLRGFFQVFYLPSSSVREKILNIWHFA